VLGSDQIRRELPSFAPGRADEFDTGAYSVTSSDAVYRELLRRAADLLAMGETVVLDATWSRAKHRTWAHDLASQASTALIEIRCDTPPDLAEERLLVRTAGSSDLSEATPSILREMTARFDPWPSANVVDTSGPQADAIERALSSTRPS
jgi:predicted kinase